jgi:hypothetical protein
MNSHADAAARVTATEAYPALVQLVIHAESISWNRFYNFLMGNSILVLAWATIFVSRAACTVAGRSVLAAICMLGAASGVAWAALSFRGRRSLFVFLDLGQTLERGKPPWTSELGELTPLSTAANLRDKQAFGWAGSLYLLVIGSLAFSALYSVMLVASVGWTWAAVPLALTVIAVVWFGISFCSALRSQEARPPDPAEPSDGGDRPRDEEASRG